MFSWKRRTVASSSVCNFLGVETTNAEAESTSARRREKDKANEVQTTKRESTNGGLGFWVFKEIDSSFEPKKAVIILGVLVRFTELRKGVVDLGIMLCFLRKELQKVEEKEEEERENTRE